jgi:hypothetical protein
MSPSLPNDLALSTTFHPSSFHTYSVIYGCNPSQTDAVVSRLRAAAASPGNYTNHPLLLAGIFAELERQRLIAAADGLVDRFAISSNAITQVAQWDPNSLQIRDYFAICLESRNLVDHFRAVKRQLGSFLEEVEALKQFWEYGEPAGECDCECRARSAVETGRRIKRRVMDIMVEYDDKIDECEMIAQNLPLAMKTVRPCHSHLGHFETSN